MLEIKFTKDEGIPDPYIEMGNSGFDLRASHDAVLSINKPELIRTGLYFEIPIGYEMQIRPRSGLALHRGIMVVNSPGTIDSNYRGEIGVILLNTQAQPFEIKKGDRIAQAVIVEVPRVKFIPVSYLSASDRGTKGFGSSGVK